MIETTIDLAALALNARVLTNGSNVLSGRQAGIKVRREARLGIIGPQDRLVLKVSEQLVVAPAFFVGLLSGSFDAAANSADAAERITLHGGSPFVRVNLNAALAVVAGSPTLAARIAALPSA